MKITICSQCFAVVSVDASDLQVRLGDKVTKVADCPFCDKKLTDTQKIRLDSIKTAVSTESSKGSSQIENILKEKRAHDTNTKPSIEQIVEAKSIPTKGKIFVIEDDHNIIRIIRFTLEKDGYEVIVAMDGQQALVKLNELSSIDLAIIDIMMPKFNGLEVVKMLRADDRFSKLPVIVITAIQDSTTAKTAFSVGADRFFEKPLKLNELTKAVDLLVSESRKGR